MDEQIIFYTSSNGHIPGWLIVSAIIIGIILLLVYIFFYWTMYTTLKKIPENKRLFPAWFCWMQIIPVAGYIFNWLMMPFGLPRSFENHLKDNPEAVNQAKALFGIGLAYVILPLLMWIPFVNLILLIVSIILLIIYWVRLIRFKAKFLTTSPSEKSPPSSE